MVSGAASVREEVGEVVGQSVELQTNFVGGKPHAGEPRPFERVFALFYPRLAAYACMREKVLLGGASAIVEHQHPLVRQAAIGDDEADGREQLAGMELRPGHDPARF